MSNHSMKSGFNDDREDGRPDDVGPIVDARDVEWLIDGRMLHLAMIYHAQNEARIAHRHLQQQLEAPRRLTNADNSPRAEGQSSVNASKLTQNGPADPDTDTWNCGDLEVSRRIGQK